MINISNLFVTVNKGSLHEKIILRQINLSIQNGEFVVLGGNNGSGKSVLFDIMSGGLKHDLGIVSLDLQQEGDYYTDIEYIKSDINYFITRSETFIENIFLNQLNKKSTFGFVCRKSAYSEIEEYIKSFGFGEDIDKMLYKSFKELPKHYEHVLVLLIAAVNKPKLMLIDDIFSGLDETETKSILDIIKKIHTKQKCTIILSTCNPYTAAKLHGRKVILSNGAIVKDTITEKVMDHREAVDLFNQHLKFAYEKDCVLLPCKKDDKKNSVECVLSSYTNDEGSVSLTKNIIYGEVDKKRELSDSEPVSVRPKSDKKSKQNHKERSGGEKPASVSGEPPHKRGRKPGRKI